MSRCLFRKLFGVFLVCGAISPAVAENLPLWNATPVSAVTLELFASSLDDHFQDHRLTLNGASLDQGMNFESETPSPLFAAVNIPEANNSDMSGGPAVSDWDHLWHNATRIPATVIPEPSAAALLLVGAILFCARRANNRRT